MHDITWARFADIDPYTAYSLLRLRSEVFVVEQACAFLDLDGRDVFDDTDHGWIRGTDGQVIACIRVFSYIAAGHDAVKISRVVTHPSRRGEGLGDALMNDAIARYGDRTIVLDAQSRLEAFYERFGFVRDGERFLEDDILHTPMRRGAAT